MRFEEYLAKQRQDPEYLAAERELAPVLDLADDVLDLRMEKGWSQADLARKVGTRQSNISRVENGLANPTLRFLQRLAQALGAALEIRLRRTGEARPPSVPAAPAARVCTVAVSFEDQAPDVTVLIEPYSMPESGLCYLLTMNRESSSSRVVERSTT